MNETDSAQPETIGPYEIQEPLGAGGMSVVYLARQPSLDRQVAVKVLPASFAQDPAAIARFERESKVVAQLAHPGVIQIFDRGIDDRRYYIVMEYVRGCSLEDLLREGQLGIHQIVDIGLQVARALAYAHGKGVVHRDIKPANILVSSDSGTIKIADFGIAQLAEAQLRGETLTRENTGMGTLNYMAPEQRLNARAVDQRADIFAFGVILYEMLTGRPPLGHFKPPIELRDDTPPPLSALVMRCLQQSPADRYQRCEDLLVDLERVTVLNLRYREALARMTLTVRRVSGKATTELLVKAGSALRGRAGRRLALGTALVVAAVLVTLGVRNLVGGARRGGGPARSTQAGDAIAQRFALAAAARQRGEFASALVMLRGIRDAPSDSVGLHAQGEAQWLIAEIHRQTGDAHYAGIAYGYFYDHYHDTGVFRESDEVRQAVYWAGHFKETEKKNDERAALGYYEQLIAGYPDHPRLDEALFRAAYLLHKEVRPSRNQQQAHYRRAAAYYRRVIDEFPDSPSRHDAYYWLGELYDDKIRLGRKRDDAAMAQLYEDMGRDYPRSQYDPLYRAAEIAQQKLGDDARAIRLYERFLAERPQSRHAKSARQRLKRLGAS